jgi:AcrR family transcriptional regulator
MQQSSSARRSSARSRRPRTPMRQPCKRCEATSVEELTSPIGIDRGSLYNTFAGKHELFLEALDRTDAYHARRSPRTEAASLASRRHRDGGADRGRGRVVRRRALGLRGHRRGGGRRRRCSSTPSRSSAASPAPSRTGGSSSPSDSAATAPDAPTSRNEGRRRWPGVRAAVGREPSPVPAFARVG